MAWEMPDMTTHPGGDVPADPQPDLFVVCVVYFGKHREALPVAIDTQCDDTAFSHAVDRLGCPLDIVWVEVPACQHDEIL